MPAPVSSPGSTPADRWRRLRAGLEAQGSLDPAAAGLIAFARATFPGYRPAPHHRKIAEALEAVARGDCRRLMIFMPPRHGKPLYTCSMILIENGTYRRLAEIAPGDRVITHLGRSRTVLAVHEQGNLPCVRIRTWSGRETVAALDHPFLTPEGWVKAGDLRPGMALANVSGPRTVAGNDNTATFRLAGYFIGDGSVGYVNRAKGINAKITAYDPVERDDIRASALACGFTVGKDDRDAITLTGGVRDWLRDVGMAGKTARQKRVPEFVFRGSADQIGHFLGAYFACDGSINKRGKARRDAAAEFYSVNRDLLIDVQRLLLRIGVQSALRYKAVRYNGGTVDSWRLTITSQDDVARFVARATIRHEKAVTLRDWTIARTRFDEALLADPVVTVEDAGALPCRCLTVDDDHTFTSDDFVVHNSELASVRFPPWYLGTYPDRRIIAASYAASLAYRFSRQARNLLTLPAYHRLFPAISVAGDAGAVQQWDIAGHRGGYLAAGVGGPLTGQGANLLLVDDPVKSRAEADSPTIRDTVWDWYQGTAYTRLEDDAAIVLVQTRWHEDDLAGRLLREQGQGGDRWEVLNLPALAEAGDPLGRMPGEALWPEKYDQAELERIKAAVGSRNWQSLYQGAPTSERGGLFKRHWWRRYGAFDRTQAREVIQLWDTAFSERTSADYSVCATWAQTDTGYYVLDVWRGQIGFPDLKRLAGDLFGRWHPAAILVEAKASGISLIQELQRETVLPVVAVPVSAADGDKVARANAAAPTVEAGRVYLPETAPWVHDFIEEHASFPLGAHDDMVDTTSMALHRWVGFNDVASFLAAMRGSTN